MILTLDDFLSTQELDFIRDHLREGHFVDGSSSAGWYAKLVKNNQQLAKETDYFGSLTNLIHQAFKRHLVCNLFAQPKVIHNLKFSCYKEGMAYGRHTDNALMGPDHDRHRSDLSFTVFLNDPGEYEGGELVIELLNEQQSLKLNRGAIVVYPSTTLHEVTMVTGGVRYVAVGWIESWVRDSQQRDILMDLETVRRSIFAKDGKSVEFDLLSKAYSNLLRQWSQ